MEVRRMTIWTAGKHGIIAIQDIIVDILVLIYILATQIIAIWIPYNTLDVRIHLSFVVGIVAIIGYIVSISDIVKSVWRLKHNRQVSLVVLSMQEFCGIGSIPPGYRILFSDIEGVILCEIDGIDEASYFASKIDKFVNFIHYYEHKAEEKNMLVIKIRD